MLNSTKEKFHLPTTVHGKMAVAPQSAVEALGFSPGRLHVPGPSYTRFTVVDVWDGNRVVPTVMHLPLSTSLITSLILQCDPDLVIRYMKFQIVFVRSCLVMHYIGIPLHLIRSKLYFKQ